MWAIHPNSCVQLPADIDQGHATIIRLPLPSRLAVPRHALQPQHTLAELSRVDRHSAVLGILDLRGDYVDGIRMVGGRRENDGMPAGSMASKVGGANQVCKHGFVRIEVFLRIVIDP